MSVGMEIRLVDKLRNCFCIGCTVKCGQSFNGKSSAVIKHLVQISNKGLNIQLEYLI